MEYLFDGPEYFVSHPLVSYGNHTARHYVLGSLSREQQECEISAVRRRLSGIPGIRVSEVFAAPFGEERHLNYETFEALRDLGYRYLLLNRGGVNRRLCARFGVEIVERFSALDEPIEWQLKRQAARRRGAFNPVA